MKSLQTAKQAMLIIAGLFGSVNGMAKSQSLSLNSNATESEVLNHYGFNAYEFLHPTKKTYQGRYLQKDADLLSAARSYCTRHFESCEDFSVSGGNLVSYWAKQPKTSHLIDLDPPARWALSCSWKDQKTNFETHRRIESDSRSRTSATSDCVAGANGESSCDADYENSNYSRYRLQERSIPVVHKLTKQQVCTQIVTCESGLADELDRFSHEHEILSHNKINVNQSKLGSNLNQINARLNAINRAKAIYCE
jgi:hypothetical protein